MKYLSILFLFFSIILSAQVGIGTTIPNANTMLDINSNSKGVLFPRLTDAQRDAIAIPAEGLFIYNLDSHDYQYYNGTEWLALATIPVNNNLNNLFISEYCEGSGNNKYIEIYNPNNANFDLSGYKIELYYNGSSTPTTFLLSGIIAPNDVFVVHHNSADATIIAAGDHSTTLNFNGDDAVVLVKDGVNVDIIGVIGVDPGNGWSVAGTTNATQNHTLKRKSGITSGNTNWSASAGTTVADSEWEVLTVDDFTDLGTHTP